jgi:hypothetical protein
MDIQERGITSAEIQRRASEASFEKGLKGQ